MSAETGRGGRTRLLVVAALVIAVVIALNEALPNIDLQQALHDVSTKLGSLTYLVVGVAALLETGAFIGLLLPGETVVLLGGAVAGQGETSVVLTIGVVWVCAAAGDSISFLIGRRLGRGFLLRRGSAMRITPERFERVEAYFRRHGGKTILIGRFIGVVRAVAPFSAGSSGMRYLAFLPYSVLGTGLWAAAFVLVGYFASQSLDRASHLAGRGLLLFAIVVGVVVGVILAVRFLREAENRERAAAAMERSALLRPLWRLARRVAPGARFVADRFTPGGLGLQFTTLVAALAVGLYVLVAYTVTISGHPGPTAADSTAFDAARHLRADWLTSAAKVVTALGSAGVVVAVGAVSAILLAIRRHWAEIAVLVVAMAIVFVGVSDLKSAIARPRPMGALAGAEGYAFPSGHAAQSIIYPWLALIVTARLRRGMAGASALFAAGVALAVLIGLTRVYLRVHYFSDVAAGWAFGVAAFTATAAAAMLVTHLRHNATDASPGDRD